MSGRERALGRTAVVAALLGCVLAVGWWIRPGAPGAFLAGGPGEWIVTPLEQRSSARTAREVETSFERVFELEAVPSSALLSLRALGAADVSVNGQEILRGVGKALAEAQVGAALRAGANRIRVRVRNATGPPALSLRLEGEGNRLLESDAHWQSSLAAGVAWPVRVASRPQSLGPPLAERAPPRAAPLALLLFGAIAALGAALGPRLAARFAGRPWLWWGAATLAWIALYANAAGQYPPLAGFDAPHHLDYVRFLMERGALPLPGDGVQMYQPPLFYALTALWLGALGLEPEGATALRASRVLVASCGVVYLAAVLACVRRVVRGRPVAQAAALVLAAALPMHLALFNSFSNEALAAALGAVCVAGVLHLLDSDDPSRAGALALGAGIGAALLAKFSLLPLVPLGLGALVLRHPRRLSRVALVAVAALAVCGWHYVRIGLATGNPFLGNWDPAIGYGWWQDPGFRTPGDYLLFGAALGSPWFAGFHGVWDGLYSTLWADGLASGAPERLLGPTWNWGLARQGVWLGLLPSAVLALGGVLALRRVWRRPDPAALFLLGLAVAMALAFVRMTLLVPSYAQAKASYLHLAAVPACAAFALGAHFLLQRGRVVRVAFGCALAIWALNAYASFWMLPGTPAALLQESEKALAARDPARAQRAVAALAEAGGHEARVLLATCRVHLLAKRVESAREPCEAALARSPADPDALFAAAQLDRRTGRPERAERRLRELIRVAPRDHRGYMALSRLLAERGEREAAHPVAAQWLRFSPTSAHARELAGLPLARGAAAPPLRLR